MKTMDRKKLQGMVLAAFFVALVLLLGMTPLGLIPLGFINVTILCVPVIVGTLALGLKTGLLLGATFGLTSTLRVFGIPLPPSTLSALLLGKSPLLAIVMCMLPRLLVPVAAHFVFKLFSRGERKASALPFAAIAGSVTNTVLYLGMMLLFFVMVGLDSTEVLALIGGTGLIAGASEAAVAAILVTPITIALWKMQPQKI